MSTHEQAAVKQAVNGLTDAQVIELAADIREMWRQEVATGRMKLEPRRMRAFDRDLAELRALTKG